MSPQDPEYPYKARVRMWRDALLSGDYPQGQGYLRIERCVSDQDPTREWKYCCLGVATDVALKNGLTSFGFVDERGAQNPAGNSVLWPEVAEWYGFESSNPEVASGLTACSANDNSMWTFTMIAASLSIHYRLDEPEENE
jgi:hypothetical protein